MYGEGGRLEVGGWRLEGGGGRVEAGGWRLEPGGWRVQAGGWSLPRSARYGSRDVQKLHKLFDGAAAAGNEAAGKLRCSASELLALYGLLEHWITAHVSDHDDLWMPKLCFSKMCTAVDMILQVKRQKRSGPDVWTRAPGHPRGTPELVQALFWRGERAAEVPFVLRRRRAAARLQSSPDGRIRD